MLRTIIGVTKTAISESGNSSKRQSISNPIQSNAKPTDLRQAGRQGADRADPPNPENKPSNLNRLAQVMLRVVGSMAAAEIIHTGEILVTGGVNAAAIGGPIGVAVGVPVALLGVGITAGGVILGANALGINSALGLPDLGFPKADIPECITCAAGR